jgi:DNA-binding SARP family transcriptional activator
MLRLQTLDGLSLARDQHGLVQPRMRLALLARLAVAGDRALSRDEMLALLWSERDTDSARHSLDQLLYEMRRALGESPVCGSDALRLDSSVITTDVDEFQSALEQGDLPRAVGLYRGPLLRGFFLPKAPEFERWVESARAALQHRYHHALERLVLETLDAGEPGAAVQYASQWATADPLSTRAILLTMRALASSGDRAEALRWARQHERIVKAELESDVDQEILAYAEELRSASTTTRGSAATTARQVLTTPSSASEIPSRPKRGITALVTGGTVVVALAAALSHGGRRSRVDATGAMSGLRLTTNIPAYEYYLRAREPSLTRSDSGVRAAIELLRRAVALDSSFTAAYAALGYYYATAAWGSDLPVSERQSMYVNAAMAATRAVTLDFSSSEAHHQLAYVKLTGHDVTGAIAEAKRAIALDSSDVEARQILAKAYEYAEQPSAAVEEARRAAQSQPLAAAARAELGYALYFDGKNQEALAELSSVTKLEPPLRRVPGYVAEVYLSQGKWGEAVALLRSLRNQSHQQDGLIGFALARSGASSAAGGILGQLMPVAQDSGYAFEIAEIYVGLRDLDRAFFWLDRSVDDFSILPIISGPLFAEVRADRRFEHLRRRLNLPVDR